MAKYPYIVNKNGVWYASGTEIPEDSKAENNEKTEAIKEKNLLDEFAETVTEDRNAKKLVYTKTEINRMSTAELKDLAKENGIDDELTGAEIKKALIAKFGL